MKHQIVQHRKQTRILSFSSIYIPLISIAGNDEEVVRHNIQRCVMKYTVEIVSFYLKFKKSLLFILWDFYFLLIIRCSWCLLSCKLEGTSKFVCQ